MEDDRERWRGKVDSELRGIGNRLTSMEADIHSVERSQSDLGIKVQALATKIAVYSSLGAFAGGGVVSIVIGLFFRKQ